MKQKLLQRNFSEELTEKVLLHLQQRGLLSDERYARMRIAALDRRRPVSRKGLEADLKQRGVAPVLIENILAEEWSSQKESAALERAIEKYKRKKANVDQDKMLRFLLGKGFSFQKIKKKIDMCEQ